MRILIVSDCYPPEIGSGAQLMAELAEGLTARGHAVTVLTNWPASKLDGSALLPEVSEQKIEHGIQILRAHTLPLHRAGFILRGIAQLAAPYQYWRTLRRYEKVPFDTVIVYSPPLTLSYIGKWAKKAGSRFILNVQDLFPQNAIDLGILSNPAAVSLFRYIERVAYRAADVITAHSKRNRDMIAKFDPQITNKLVVLHNWVDLSRIERSYPAEDFRRKFGLEGKLIALYGGVIGPAQGLDIILDVAERVRDISDLVFLVVGDGLERPRLQAAARERRLCNVMFQPFVSRERFPSLLKSVDMGFLTLSAKMKTPVVPGKLLGFMASGLPVLAIVNAESDAHTIIAEAQCGYSCNSDNPALGEAVVRQLCSNRSALATLGRRGQDYARVNFEKSVILDRLERLFFRTESAGGFHQLPARLH